MQVWSFSPPDEYQLDHDRSTSPLSLPERHNDTALDDNDVKFEDGDSIMCDI
jgi:hypothetical protein